MNRFQDLLTRLWSLSLAQARAFAAHWGAVLPAHLPRKAFHAARRELVMIESVLRRALYAEALRAFAKAPPRLTAPAVVRKKAVKPERSITTPAKSVAARPPRFRFDDPEHEAQPSRPFYRPRILSFDEILAMPPYVPVERADGYRTAPLARRLQAIEQVLRDPAVTVARLVRRLAQKDSPRLTPVRAIKPAHPAARPIHDADLIFPRLFIHLTTPAPNSS